MMVKMAEPRGPRGWGLNPAGQPVARKDVEGPRPERHQRMGPEPGRLAMELALEADGRAQDETERQAACQLGTEAEAKMRGQTLTSCAPGVAASGSAPSSRDHQVETQTWSAPR